MNEFREQIDPLHPLGQIGEPDDNADGIIYLASDEPHFVSGRELVIDSGYTAATRTARTPVIEKST